MNDHLLVDWRNLEKLLERARERAHAFLQDTERRPAARTWPARETTDAPFGKMPAQGQGAAGALTSFLEKHEAHLSGSVGARYWGFVTGGATPAALIGDWLAAAYDQNVIVDADSCATRVEQETIHLLRKLFSLPPSFHGAFVSGATMSNFVGLAQARQWVAGQLGRDAARDGLYSLPALRVLSATPHASIFKSLAMLGMGKSNLTRIDTLPGREAMDVANLTRWLEAPSAMPAIVIASAASVNTADFDDLQAIVALRKRTSFWLHVDAAFGGFAACSPHYSHLLSGLEEADSITIDAHKWLNVPYDSAMTFSRHPELQVSVFENSAAYLDPADASLSPLHWTPQNSRRFRALPAWMTLVAYGRSGYREIVERNCSVAKWLGRQIDQSPHFRLLAPVRLNVVCFTLAPGPEGSVPDSRAVARFLRWLQADGRCFLTPTHLDGTPAIRAAFSNWRTTQADVELGWQALQEAVVEYDRPG